MQLILNKFHDVSNKNLNWLKTNMINDLQVYKKSMGKKKNKHYVFILYDNSLPDARRISLRATRTIKKKSTF